MAENAEESRFCRIFVPSQEVYRRRAEAFMDKDEIKREIRWMAEAGYGGAEIGKKTNFTDEFEGEG
ncbi:hypothetical protein [Paenibacillus polysaccharolyticus]|uniref:hypothetical protein n=1 Tax=Paenibacillus polysaccharolyticus TaxID=582692 RepID=UPI00300B39D6